jgi:hypothetical protein
MGGLHVASVADNSPGKHDVGGPEPAGGCVPCERQVFGLLQREAGRAMSGRLARSFESVEYLVLCRTRGSDRHSADCRGTTADSSAISARAT